MANNVKLLLKQLSSLRGLYHANLLSTYCRYGPPIPNPCSNDPIVWRVRLFNLLVMRVDDDHCYAINEGQSSLYIPHCFR